MDLEIAYDKIYRYVYFRIQNREAAEDITQETFLRYIGSAGTIHGYEMKYLYTISRNLCIDEYRRVKPEPLPEDHDEKLSFSDGSQDDRIAVRAALDRLPYEDREILLLRHVNGEAVGTISKALDISRFSVYRRLKSAEDRLRAELEDQG